MFDEEFPSLKPAGFFEMTVTVPYLKEGSWQKEIEKGAYALPDTGWLLDETHKSKVHLAWREEGLYFFVHVKGAFHEPVYPVIANGDSVELFIDTRGNKAPSYNTKFSHHFYFLPQAFEGHEKGEITTFRTEDAHPLADPDALEFGATGSVKEGKLKGFIPTSVLTGYDPKSCPRIGFSYRINHKNGVPEHFSFPGDLYPLEKDPSLWILCELKQKP